MPPKPQAALSEIGVSGLSVQGGRIHEEFLPALQGDRARKVWREMSEQDPTVGGILFAIEMVLRQVEWTVTPGGEEEPDLAAATFLEECMADMSQTWDDVVAEALTMLPYGHSVAEVVYKKRAGGTKDPASRFTDGKIGWRKFAFRAQDTIQEWVFDDNGGLQGFVQQSPTSGERYEIPIDKCLLFRTTTRKGNPEGSSVLRRCWWSWLRKRNVEIAEGIGIERDLAGFPVLYVDADILKDTTRYAEYQKVVRDIKRDEQEGLLLPGNRDEKGHRRVELELVTSGGQRQFDTSAVIARYTREIATAVLADVILLGHEKVGSFALAGEKRDLFTVALDAWNQSIAAVFNRFEIPRLLALNGMDVETPPTLTPSKLKTLDMREFAEAVKSVASVGYDLFDEETENFVRSELGLPEKPEQDDATMFQKP